MFKQCNVVMLPSNEKATIGLSQPFNVLYSHEQVVSHEGQQLYITDDSEIKGGDWCYDEVSKNVYLENDAQRANACNYIWKIIATTDTSLFVNGNLSYPYEESIAICKLPEMSQSFINHFITEYNKGNVISKVMVEYDELYQFPDGSYSVSAQTMLRAKPVNKLKLNPSNTINIKYKDSWSREEVINLIASSWEMGSANGDYNSLTEAKEEFDRFINNL